MKKKLKKVDEKQKAIALQKEFSDKIAKLNDAYKFGNGEQIDNSIKDLFSFLDTIMPNDSPPYVQLKNHTWQKNHLKILGTVSTLMQSLNRMPSNTEIAVECRLSEETIYKHLREFKEHYLYSHETDKYRLMIHRVLTTVFNLGVQGDVRACKVYLDYFNGNVHSNPPNLIEQTNYIQINNLKITPNELRQLPPEILQKMENLIKRPANRIFKKVNCS
jgi:hypothetical protein